MKISVIIPTYNGEATIIRAVSSVLLQTYKCDFELIICDDCSTDKTIEFARKMFYANSGHVGQTKELIIINSETNSGGPNKGKNNGIKRATGDYIAFLDQDDEWLPEKLSIQLKEDSDFIYSSYIKKHEKV